MSVPDGPWKRRRNMIELQEGLRASARAFREHTVYDSDGDPMRLIVQADEADQAADELDRLTAEIDRLYRLTDDMASYWLDLQDKHPIAWEGGLDEAMRAACAEIERLRLDSTHTCHDQCQREACVLRRERDAMAIENSRLRAKLELTPENVERVCLAWRGHKTDVEAATAAIKAMGDE